MAEVLDFQHVQEELMWRHAHTLPYILYKFLCSAALIASVPAQVIEPSTQVRVQGP